MRKRYSPELKAQIVLELLREEKTVSQLASDYGIHHSVINRWKNQALENLPQVFSNDENVEAIKKEYEAKIEELYTEIGRLSTQLAWLKKKRHRN